jgi:hypothetical protein
MSGTPEYYFQQRWAGLENISAVIGNKTYSNKTNSVDLDFGERLQDLVQVISSILGNSDEIREALLENRLSEGALYNDFSVIEQRIESAISTLKDGMDEVLRLRNSMLTSLASLKAADYLISKNNSDDSA